MSTGEPSPGSSSSPRWRPSPRRAAAIRLLGAVVPVAAALVAATIASTIVERPGSLALQLGWWCGLIGVGAGAALAARPLLQRIMPIGYLYQLGLTFPEHAPARFAMALRRNKTRELARRVAAGEPLGDTPQEAAEHMVALLSRLTAHDRLTRGHCERVAAYSHMIGEDLGLSVDDLDRLRWSAVIHDIGKLAVSESVLNKGRSPTDGEWRELRQHPAAAEALIAPLRPWLGAWTDAATQHHERWDGRGYPAGLAGNDITPAARVVAVADAFDVMTSRRSYKTATSTDAARRELAAAAGTQFDPRVVRAFLGLPTAHLATIIGPLAWLSQHEQLSSLATRLRLGTEHAIGAAAAGGAAAALAVATFGAPAGVEAVTDIARPAIDVVDALTPGDDGSPETDGADDVPVDGTVPATDDPALPAAAGNDLAADADATTAEGDTSTDGVGAVGDEAESGDKSGDGGAEGDTGTTPGDAPEGGADSGQANGDEQPEPTAGGDTEIAGGYRVVNEVDLLLADNGWQLRSDSVVYLIAEGDPTTLTAPLTVDGPTGDRVELASGRRVCSYVVHGERSTGNGRFDFEMHVSSDVVGIARTADDLAATSWFARDELELPLGALEDGDQLDVESTGPNRSVLRGSFDATAGSDIDSIRFLVDC